MHGIKQSDVKANKVLLFQIQRKTWSKLSLDWQDVLLLGQWEGWHVRIWPISGPEVRVTMMPLMQHSPSRTRSESWQNLSKNILFTRSVCGSLTDTWSSRHRDNMTHIWPDYYTRHFTGTIEMICSSIYFYFLSILSHGQCDHPKLRSNNFICDNEVAYGRNSGIFLIFEHYHRMFNNFNLSIKFNLISPLMHFMNEKIVKEHIITIIV